MDGYYDYTPLASLGKHLVIAGYIGEETRLIGYQLASLTGLPVTDLDRKVEHHAGKSVWELIWSEGEGRYRNLEQEHLRGLLAARPFSILTLGDGALIAAENRRLVAGCHLVALDLDLANCYWRLKSGVARDRENWHPLYPGPLERFEQLRPFYDLRAPGLAAADHQIPLRGKGRNEVVAALIELLPALG